MNEAHQEVSARRGARFPLSLRFWWGIGLALTIGIWTSPDAWALTVSPTAISFQAVQGGTNPPIQSLSVSKGNNKPSTWTATDSAAWLTVSPGAGSIISAAQMAMAVNTSGLAAGIYSATVTIIVVKGGSAVIPVTLTVAPPPTTTPPPPPTSSSTTPTTNTSSGTSTSTTNTSSGTTTTPTAAPPQITNLTNITASGLTVTCANQPAAIRYQTDLSSTVINPVSCNPTYSLVRKWVSGETFICVYARNAAGVENTVNYLCVPAPTTTPPPPPTSSSTTPTTGTSTTASLSWSPPTNITGVAGYNVYVGTASGVYGPPINVGNVTTYVVNNLVIGNTYYFVVKDYNSSGVESPPSNEVSKSIY